MNELQIYHGSNKIITNPQLHLGKIHNDYGQGFYCTLHYEMALEWAAKENKDGFVNEYNLNLSNLKILNLLDEKYNILNWISILLKNRFFRLNDEIEMAAKEYIIQNFYIDTSKYDVVIGYRADDSYFSYAQSFISNTLPIRNLEKALKLGQLGTQIVLVSEKAFKQIKFIKSTPVDKNIYYPKFVSRDTKAREEYHNKIKNDKNFKNDIFVMDILRKEMKNDDIRIQRTISK